MLSVFLTLLETDIAKKQKRVLGQGNSVVHIYPSDLFKVKLPLPPLPEQKAIAHVLGLMDSAINTNNKLIAKKELQKKWLMQQLLSEKLIVKNEKWCRSGLRIVELGKLGRIVSGGTPSTINEVVLEWGSKLDYTN